MEHHDKRREVVNLIIWIADYFMGFFSYGDLLLLVKDALSFSFDDRDMIIAATKGAVRDAVEDLTNALTDEGIVSIKRSSKRIGHICISFLLCIPRAKIIVVRDPLPEQKERALEEEGWKVVLVSEIKDYDSFEKTLRFIRSNIR